MSETLWFVVIVLLLVLPFSLILGFLYAASRFDPLACLPPRRRPARGTVTVLPDGRIVFGLPTGDFTNEDVAAIKRVVGAWLRLGDRPLVLGWPVDVIDLRRKP